MPAPPTDNEIGKLARAIRLPRQQVADIYDKLATEHGAYRLKVAEVMGPDNAAPYVSALKQAWEGDWHRELLDQLLAAGAIPEIDDPTPEGNAIRMQLHGIVDTKLGFIDADLLHSGNITARRRVCLIEINAPTFRTEGTGFLVGPQAVITSFHVIDRLLDATGRVSPGSEQFITVHFDKFGGARQGTIAKVQPEWLIKKSPFHPKESPTKAVLDLADDPGGFDVHLDYAVIRLQAPVGRERGYYRLDPARVPQIGDHGAQITLFQHPGGQGMKVAPGAGVALWPPAIKTRFRHTANAIEGSSGGLVLDHQFEPVALHQCGLKDASGITLVNGAIPTASIVSSKLDCESVVGLDPIWRIPESGEAIVGRDKFQESVLDMLTGGARILVVTGIPKSGKTFSTKILRAMLGVAEHRVVELSSSALPEKAEDLAALLLSKLLPTAPPSQAPLPAQSSSETTMTAWIRDSLVPAFIGRLQSGAGSDTLWLVIDDLDAHPMTHSVTKTFFEELYRSILSAPSLRLVLIGHNDPVSGAPSGRVRHDATAELTIEEVETYIMRRAEELDPKKPVPASEARTLAVFAMNVVPRGQVNVGPLGNLMTEAMERTLLAR